MLSWSPLIHPLPIPTPTHLSLKSQDPKIVPGNKQKKLLRCDAMKALLSIRKESGRKDLNFENYVYSIPQKLELELELK